MTILTALLLWTSLFRITPNDPKFNQQWGLHSINDADINAPKAWEIETGDASIIISIIDTGLDNETHPEFQGRIVSGWNFIDNNANFLDEKGHGTNVTGVAAASTNNGKGMAGVAGGWEVDNDGISIMPLKVATEISWSGAGALTEDVANAVNWAVNHGAKIINISLGVSRHVDNLLKDAIYNAYLNNVVIVTSIGNSGEPPGPSDYPAYWGYPSVYRDLSGWVISVGAINENKQRTSWSSYVNGDSKWGQE